MQYVFDRIKEPSTWAGIAVLLGAFGVKMAPDMWEGIVGVVVAVAALAAILMKEKSA